MGGPFSRNTAPAAERFRKQTLFAGIGEVGQQKLAAATAVVIGCGALGSVIAESLARAGIGTLRLIDRDFVELSNLQRQVLYDENDVAERLPKAIAAQRKLRQINSNCLIESHVADVTNANILALVSGADVIMDGTDNFETRFLINDAAVETQIPWVHAGCVGARGQVMAILPNRTPCLRCLMPDIPAAGTSETCDTAGVIGPAVQIVASWQVIHALKIVTEQSDLIRPELTILDLWEGTVRQMQLDQLNADRRCACCCKGDRTWLEGREGAQTTILCGRNSVQISPGQPTRLSLEELQPRLAESGSVRSNPFLLVFSPSESDCELTIFRDGRAIISGTEETALARSLYARYVGQ